MGKLFSSHYYFCRFLYKVIAFSTFTAPLFLEIKYENHLARIIQNSG